MRISPVLFVSLSASALALSAGVARAQSFNLDVGDNLILSPVPSSSYGGVANQAGVWNNVKTPYSTTLFNLNGVLSSVTTASTSPNAFNYPGFANGDDQDLMYDVQDIDQFSGTATWTISGLTPGAYTIYTYAWAPENTGAQTEVSVVGSSDPMQIVGGVWSGPPHVLGVTYALHHVNVSGALVIDVAGHNASGSINGFQIVQDSSAFTPFCFGDGSATINCPCNNTGAIGHGCNNSAATGGALLSASGSTTPDSVVLTSSSELPSVLSIFLQGDSSATTPPFFFGDGLRCAAGHLKRLYSKNASGGTVSAPGPGDPSITARSAALGDTIAPGSTRYYQVYYRDPVLSFCPQPSGDSWNVSGGVIIVW
jgi:hypothetical protein